MGGQYDGTRAGSVAAIVPPPQAQHALDTFETALSSAHDEIASA